jgi:hypothetical protein
MLYTHEYYIFYYIVPFFIPQTQMNSKFIKLCDLPDRHVPLFHLQRDETKVAINYLTETHELLPNEASNPVFVSESGCKIMCTPSKVAGCPESSTTPTINTPIRLA